MIAGIAAAAAFWGALMVHGFAGPAFPGERIAIPLACLVLIGALGAGDKRVRQGWARWLGFFALIAVMILIPATTVRGVAFAAAVLLAAPSAVAGVGRGLFFAAAATALVGWLPWVSGLGDGIASWTINAIKDTEAPLQYGPSALGLPAAFFAICLLAARLVRRRGVWPLVALVLVPVAVRLQLVVAEWRHNEAVKAHIGHDHPLPEMEIFSSLGPLTLLLSIVVFLGYLGRPGGPEGDGEPAAEPAAARRGLTRGALGGFAAAAVMLFLISGWRFDGQEDHRVAYLNMGLLDWKRPVIGEFGGFVGGMFGMTPVFLQNGGWDVKVVEEEDLPEFGLDDARVLIIINCPRKWLPEERERLEDFVREGGSVLVLGDHTNVSGLMTGLEGPDYESGDGGLNSLLVPWGYEFVFDSAYHTADGWSEGLEWKPGILGLWRDPRKEGIGIGASLRIERPVQSIVQARYGFSDWGFADNYTGSFLGNYTYEENGQERLGDLVMIAGHRIGKGRVVVYGDTSGFQNGGMNFSYGDLLVPLLSKLCRPAGLAIPYWLETVAAILAVAGAGWVLVRRGAAARGAILGAAVAATLAGALQGSHDPMEPVRESNLERGVLIDYSHMPDVGHYEAGYNTIASLTTNAHRAGLVGYRMTDWEPDLVRRARVTAMIAPRVGFSESEVEDLAAAMQGGATVIVAASGPHAPEANTLLRAFGVEVSPVTLEPIPGIGEQKEQEPKFVNPSTVRIDPSVNYEPLYRYGDNLIVAAVPVGEGHLIVIGDSRFYGERNNEGLWGWWAGNLAFQNSILMEYCDGDPDLVKEVFDEPKES